MSLSPAQLSLTCVCPSCVCLTFDIHLFNNHWSSTECQKHPWPRLSLLALLFMFCTGPSVLLWTQHDVPLYTVCVWAYMPSSPTFGDPSARHLEPPLFLSLTHRIYLQYPLPSLPECCHSHARLTADIIKAVWPPDMLLAQSRNADRRRAAWALAQECPSWFIVSMCTFIC